MKVLLDAGHGGHDPGATGNRMNEKDVALSVTLKAGEILKRHKVDVIYSRTKDEFIQLSERAQIANKAKVDAFVSVHCNSFSNPLSQGAEVFSYPNSADGKELAHLILYSMLSDNVFTKNRGTKTADFAVLRETKMTAALVELGFISNVEDAAILKNKQDELAEAVAKGILAYLKIQYKEVATNNLDDQYNKAVQELMLANIIGSPAAWINLDKVHVSNVKSLIIKMAAYITQGI